MRKLTDSGDTTELFTFDQTQPANSVGCPTFFSLQGGQSRPPCVAPAGTVVRVTERAEANWRLTELSCDKGSWSADLATRQLEVTLLAAETITCTFTNTDQRGRLVVRKLTDSGDTTELFTFDQTQPANSVGCPTFFSLQGGQSRPPCVAPAGTVVRVTERAEANWRLTELSCDKGSWSADLATRQLEVTLLAAETITCTFTNTDQRGTIIVEKQTNPDGADGSFTFTGTAAGTIADGGQIVVANLAPGAYTSTEADPTPNFDLTGIVCDDGASATPSTVNLATRTATFRVDPGETVKCTFANRQRGMVELRKLTNGVARPDLDIKFALYRDGGTPGDLTGTDTKLEELVTLGDTDGLLQFQTKLVPGTLYTICENPVPAGWTSMWMISFQIGGQIVTPYNPNGNDAPPEDVGIRCFDFSVEPAQTKNFEVRNDFPGGDPRTIGYWKNWNRCTGGNQAATAAKNGGAGAGFFLVEDLLPQLVGDFSVTTCSQAVKLLSKQDQTGRNKASDAAYELGAQLLAARFNLAAGAETCTSIQQAVVSGQTLLDGIGFTGSGDYLGSKSKDPRRQRAITLAGTIDRYNNGNLC